MVLRSDGRDVAAATGAAGTLTVPDVHPWRPGEGHLHELVVSLHEGGVLVDTYVLPVGIRTVEVRGSEFLVNGEPFHFRGFSKHEDAAIPCGRTWFGWSGVDMSEGTAKGSSRGGNRPAWRGGRDVSCCSGSRWGLVVVALRAGLVVSLPRRRPVAGGRRRSRAT